MSGITTPIPWRSEAQSLNQESKCFLCARIIHLIHSFDSCFNILIYHTNCDHIFYKWLHENESSHCWLFLFLFDGSGIWITIKFLEQCFKTWIHNCSHYSRASSDMKLYCGQLSWCSSVSITFGHPTFQLPTCQDTLWWSSTDDEN